MRANPAKPASFPSTCLSWSDHLLFLLLIFLHTFLLIIFLLIFIIFLLILLMFIPSVIIFLLFINILILLSPSFPSWTLTMFLFSQFAFAFTVLSSSHSQQSFEEDKVDLLPKIKLPPMHLRSWKVAILYASATHPKIDLKTSCMEYSRKYLPV